MELWWRIERHEFWQADNDTDEAIVLESYTPTHRAVRERGTSRERLVTMVSMRLKTGERRSICESC